MNDFELLEQAYNQATKLHIKGFIRVSIAPTFTSYISMYCKNFFLHLNHIDDKNDTFYFENARDLLSKINELLGEKE
jgi:hypothetical protein